MCKLNIWNTEFDYKNRRCHLVRNGDGTNVVDSEGNVIDRDLKFSRDRRTLENKNVRGIAQIHIDY